MTATERQALIKGAVQGARGTWADLGAGEGAFSSALASLLGRGSRIYAVDRDVQALRELERELGAAFPDCPVVKVEGDFTAPLSLPPLDGIIMANSLHYQADPCATLLHVSKWLRPGGMLLIVEYDVRSGNPWVPYPVPAAQMPAVADCAGLVGCRIVASLPSRFHRRMYAAACRKAE